MNKFNNTFLKTVLLTLILSFFHAIIGEILFYISYYNDSVFENIDKIIYLLVIIYSIPIVVLFKCKHWYALLFLIVFSPISSIMFIFVFAGLFPLAEDDLGAGILGILIIGINLFSVLVGTIIGILINLTIYKKRQLNK